MSIEEQIIQWLLSLANVAIGFLLGSIITGWFTIKFVVPRIMNNPEIKEMRELWREGKELLKQVIDNQRKHAG